MNEKKNKNTSVAQISIGEDYYNMDRAERRAFLRSILEGMSPNEEVRSRASKKSS